MRLQRVLFIPIASESVELTCCCPTANSVLRLSLHSPRTSNSSFLTLQVRSSPPPETSSPMLRSSLSTSGPCPSLSSISSDFTATRLSLETYS